MTSGGGHVAARQPTKPGVPVRKQSRRGRLPPWLYPPVLVVVALVQGGLAVPVWRGLRLALFGRNTVADVTELRVETSRYSGRCTKGTGEQHQLT